MSWIELHAGFRDHVKVWRLADELNINRHEARGLLVSLWLWCTEQAKDGYVTKFSDHEIASACNANELKNAIEDTVLVAALVHTDLITEKNGKRRIHDWQKHGLRLLKASKERVRRFRAEGMGDPAKWPATRVRILKRDNYTCYYCGGRAKHVDHVIPLAQGGKNNDENLVAACPECNFKKNNRTPEQAVAAGIMGAPSNGYRVHRVTPTNLPTNLTNLPTNPESQKPKRKWRPQ